MRRFVIGSNGLRAFFCRKNIVWYALLLSMASVAEAASEEQPARNNVTAQPELFAIKENADRLRSGEFEAIGTLEITRYEKTQGETLTTVYDEEIECAFDYDGGRWLFVQARNLKAGLAIEAYGSSRKSWLALTPDYLLELL